MGNTLFFKIFLFTLFLSSKAEAKIPTNRKDSKVKVRQNATSSYFFLSRHYISSWVMDLFFKDNDERHPKIGERAFDWCIYSNLQNILCELFAQGVTNIKGYGMLELSPNESWSEPGSVAYWFSKQPYASQIDVQLGYIPTGTQINSTEKHLKRTHSCTTTIYPRIKADDLKKKIEAGYLAIIDDMMYAYLIIGMFKGKYLILDPHILYAGEDEKRIQKDLYLVDPEVLTQRNLNAGANLFLFVKKADSPTDWHKEIPVTLTQNEKDVRPHPNPPTGGVDLATYNNALIENERYFPLPSTTKLFNWFKNNVKKKKKLKQETKEEVTEVEKEEAVQPLRQNQNKTNSSNDSAALSHSSYFLIACFLALLTYMGYLRYQVAPSQLGID